MKRPQRTIIHKRGEIISLDKRLVNLNGSAMPTKAPAPEPAFETSLNETLAIRKFIEMSIEDIKAQTEQAARDRVKDFESIKHNAFVITAWLTSALLMVDGMLSEAAARSKSTLADEMKNDAPAA